MDVSAIRALQETLKKLGLYNGPIDGRRSTKVDAAAAKMITARRAELHGDPAGWSEKRKTIAAYQLVLKDANTNVGDIDGLWGTMTENAHQTRKEVEEFGAPILFRDEQPSTANPNGFPVDNVPGQSKVTSFYGPHGMKNGFTPPLQMVECPWMLKLSWDLSSKTRRIGVHRKLADSLSRVLDRVMREYGEQKIRDLRLDVYGGCYNPRIKEGGSTWSIHAWAAALDFDPDRNQLRWGRDRAVFARPEYKPWFEAWEAEGWVSLGRRKNFDWMHVQAAIPE